VLKILHSISKEQSKGGYSHCSAAPVENTDTGPAYSDHRAVCLPCTDYITNDDIINLRIDLETCAGSKQFIDNL